MKIYLSALLFVMTMGLEAKEAQWNKVSKELGAYNGSGYHLKNDVKCLEIRTYYVDKKNRINRKYWSTPLTWCIRPYRAFDQKLMKKFRDAKPNLSRNGNIGKRKAGSISNAFVLDARDKMWRMNMVEDVIRFLGDIDIRKITDKKVKELEKWRRNYYKNHPKKISQKKKILSEKL